MERPLLLLIALTFFTIAEAQNVGINATGAAPNASALLDIDAATMGTKGGLLIPRLTTVERNAIATPATSLLIFNSTTAQFEYFDGTIWRPLLSSAGGWTLLGNAGTVAATNFVGTTDAQALRFRTANQFAGSLPTVASQLVSYGLIAGQNNTGTGNTFVGNSAGQVNTTGGSNTFIGNNAGAANVTSANNTYVGTSAGAANATGQQNVYIGRLAGGNGISGSDNILIGNGAGLANTANNNVMIGSFAGNGNSTGGGNTFMGTQSGAATTTGGQNTFIGNGAGSTNSTGTQNTLIGNGAAVNANNLTNATAIGRASRVDVNNGLVLGSVNGINAATSTSLVGIGTTAPSDRLHVVGSIRMVDGNQALGRVLVSDANGTASWIDPLTVATGLTWTLTGNAGTNPATNFLGTTDNQPLRFRVNNLSAGQISTAAGGFVSYGLGAGAMNTGTGNTFIGMNAGNANTTSNSNTFIGSGAGRLVTAASNSNTLIGAGAGFNFVGGGGNVVVGNGSGAPGATPLQNVVIGVSAGLNLDADNNTFVGAISGNGNTIGAFNSFFGISSGVNNLTGSENTYVGAAAGITSTTGANNTMIGAFADVFTTNLTNASAIGHRSRVGASNALVLGSINGVNGATADVNVGIGTTSPARALHIARGASGGASNANAKLLLEDNGATYQHFLSPSTTESGLLFGTEVGSIRSAIIFNSGVADGHDFRTGGNTARMGIDASGQVGIGPNSFIDAQTSLEVDGGFTIRRPADVAVVAGANAVTVGDRSYLRVNSSGGSGLTTITLSNGLVIGQVLVVECQAVLANGFQMADGGNLNLSGGHTLNDDDTIMLIWNGSDWLELSFAAN